MNSSTSGNSARVLIVEDEPRLATVLRDYLIGAGFDVQWISDGLEVVDAVTAVWGADRVGMHLAPRGDAHDMGDSDLPGLFTKVAQELGKRGLAFLCARENFDHPPLEPTMKEAFGGVYIGNENFTAQSAREAISSGKVDAVAFGKLAIANPDLVERFRTGAELNAPDPSTFYGSGPKGYTDYPLL